MVLNWGSVKLLLLYSHGPLVVQGPPVENFFFNDGFVFYKIHVFCSLPKLRFLKLRLNFFFSFIRDQLRKVRSYSYCRYYMILLS